MPAFPVAVARAHGLALSATRAPSALDLGLGAALLATLLAGLTGSWALATLLQAAVFALAHVYQDCRSIAMIFALSIALQLVVLRSGSLWVAMGVHALYDTVAGFAYSALGARHGYPPEGVPLEPATD